MSERSSSVPAVSLRGLTKSYGSGDVAPAVAGIDLEIRDGEFFSLLGPSGSGKTTTLRMIAGFEAPTSGQIWLHGEDVTTKPPFDRDVNTVFQDYALFPHMTVAENIAYGLEVRRVPAAERAVRVQEALRMVRLEGYDERRPAQLSGGQRQRVALARALVNRPRVLLLDEPLGALDLKLREEMQVELKAIQAAVGITFVYVTHDQQEALTMSDRLAVFHRGSIVQVGAPAEVYEHPATAFVAGFVGNSNIYPDESARRSFGARGRIAIRPERIRLDEPDDLVAADEGSALGTIASVVFLGAETRYKIALDTGDDLMVAQLNLKESPMESHSAIGRRVRVTWRREHLLSLAENPQAAPA